MAVARGARRSAVETQKQIKGGLRDLDGIAIWWACSAHRFSERWEGLKRHFRVLALAWLLLVTVAQQLLASDSAAPLAQAYCSSIRDAALEARYAKQVEEIQRAEAKLKEKIKELEVYGARVEAWQEERRKFLALTEDRIVKIFAGMRPDAASLQLSNLNEIMAASIVMQLDPAVSAPILSEMEPEKAARIVAIISGSAQVGKEGR